MITVREYVDEALYMPKTAPTMTIHGIVSGAGRHEWALVTLADDEAPTLCKVIDGSPWRSLMLP